MYRFISVLDLGNRFYVSTADFEFGASPPANGRQAGSGDAVNMNMEMF